MALRIAFARAVNLGAAHRLPMAKLRALAKALKLAEARTVGQKGNLVFESAAGAAGLERRLDKATKAALNIDTEFFVRTPKELLAIVSKNPFEKAAARDPAHLLVYVMKRRPPKRRVDALKKALDGPEEIRAGARHLYLYYPKGIGRSKLTSALMDKHLAVRGTARNWNTIRTLASLACR